MLGDASCLAWGVGFDDLCRRLLTTANQRCEEASAPFAVRPGIGGAVMFFNLDDDGEVSVRAMHGSCGVSNGTKLMLAKFVRTGPKPWERGLRNKSFMAFSDIVVIGFCTVILVLAFKML